MKQITDVYCFFLMFYLLVCVFFVVVCLVFSNELSRKCDLMTGKDHLMMSFVIDIFNLDICSKHFARIL